MSRFGSKRWGKRDLGMPGLKAWQRAALKRIAEKRGQAYVDTAIRIGKTRPNPGRADQTGAGHEAFLQYLNRAAAKQLVRDVIMPRRRRVRKAKRSNPLSRGRHGAAARRRMIAQVVRAARANKRSGGGSHAVYRSITSQAFANLSGVRGRRISAAVQRGIRQGRRNPGRPRILWFLVRGRDWITATARGSESVRDALHRSYLAATGFARTNLQVTKPSDCTPGEWLGIISQHAVYKPQHSNPVPAHVAACKRCGGTGIIYLPGERKKIGTLYATHPGSWRRKACPKCQYQRSHANPPRGRFSDDTAIDSSSDADLQGLIKLCIGRVLKMGSRSEKPGDVEEYDRCAKLTKLADAELRRRQGLPPRRHRHVEDRRNPSRDPSYQGAFAVGHEPKKNGDFVDGDTVAVESPHLVHAHISRGYEVWVFGMIDPRLGDTWNYVSGPMAKSEAIQEAKRLARL